MDQNDAEMRVLCEGPIAVRDPKIQETINEIKRRGKKWEDPDFDPKKMSWSRKLYNTLQRNQGAWDWMRPEEFLTSPTLFSRDVGQSSAHTAPDAAYHRGQGGIEYIRVKQGAVGDW